MVQPVGKAITLRISRESGKTDENPPQAIRGDLSVGGSAEISVQAKASQNAAKGL